MNLMRDFVASKSDVSFSSEASICFAFKIQVIQKGVVTIQYSLTYFPPEQIRKMNDEIKWPN